MDAQARLQRKFALGGALQGSDGKFGKLLWLEWGNEELSVTGRLQERLCIRSEPSTEDMYLPKPQRRQVDGKCHFLAHQRSYHML